MIEIYCDVNEISIKIKKMHRNMGLDVAAIISVLVSSVSSNITEVFFVVMCLHHRCHQKRHKKIRSICVSETIHAIIFLPSHNN